MMLLIALKLQKVLPWSEIVFGSEGFYADRSAMWIQCNMKNTYGMRTNIISMIRQLLKFIKAIHGNILIEKLEGNNQLPCILFVVMQAG